MKVFAQNRKARNSYNFEEFYEAGVVLSGAETKSIRTGSVSIVDAFAIIENEEAFIMEMNIEPYKYADQIDYDPKSQRKLLLHKNEIKRLIGLTSQKGFTLVFDFPIYKEIYSVLNKVDSIVLNYKGKIYLTKDSRISKKKFLKINKEFHKKDYKNYRKKINYYFNSVQSKRLGI